MNQCNKRGFTYLEVIVATSMLVIVVGAFVAFVQSISKTQTMSREQTQGDKLIELGFTRLKGIDFYYLYPADSSQSDYGLPGPFREYGSGGTLVKTYSVYPYKQVLDNFLADVRKAKYDNFTIEIGFLRRDRTDYNVNGSTNDLVFFVDANNNDIDDNDPQIRLTDFDSDGQYHSTFLSTASWPYTGSRMSELPSTNIRSVTIKLWKNGNNILSKTTLINQDLLTGIQRVSADSLLGLNITEPHPNSSLFEMFPGAQQNAQTLGITVPYPANIYAHRADSLNPLRFFGITEGDAVVGVKANSMASPETTTSNAGTGVFDFSPALITSNLVEGRNTITVRVSKGALNSPIREMSLILDKRPPIMTTAYPASAATVNSRSPLVGARIRDDVSFSTSVSGICPNVTKVLIDTNPMNTRVLYLAENDYLAYAVDSSSLPVTLTPGLHDVEVEFGDNAKYKVSETWNFTVDNPADSSKPTTDSCSPTGTIATNRPTIRKRIQDPETGIDPSTIVFYLDGTPVVSSGLGNIYKHYDPHTGFVEYTPPAALTPPGSLHTYDIAGTNWASPPLSSDPSTCSFTVP